MEEGVPPDFDSIEEEIQTEMQQLKDVYLRNLIERHSSLTRALAENDFAEMDDIGHRIKGSGSTTDLMKSANWAAKSKSLPGNKICRNCKTSFNALASS
ncbi:Hpt domain-containing protein [candidate division KSB1 bacterium]|nr:Hpt domain-containing protein [candidate division KSB1 bacterium]NIR72014.1 Hpt domain-containing protein [candidate division KSB1 bacterium]NIS24593.1 Hpt domain-containing protein [candidate division KSB1 bacterium]NIT71502.1 Hpt domain-containing protein [candidate division KSB1 bacterium]NIU24146.1 Hpt domain-containing protein [candidate division KSB1 bacterium]